MMAFGLGSVLSYFFCKRSLLVEDMEKKESLKVSIREMHERANRRDVGE